MDSKSHPDDYPGLKPGEERPGASPLGDFYDFAPIGCLSLDEKGVVRRANLRTAELLGTAGSRLVGGPFAFFVSPGSLGAFSRHLAALGQGDRQTCEIVLTRTDGAPFHALMESRPVGGREAPEFHSTIVDITAQKKTEETLRSERAALEVRTRELTAANEALRGEIAQRQAIEQELAESKERLANMLDSITDAFATLDSEGRIAYVNDEALRLFRKSREELMGKHLWEDLLPRWMGSFSWQQYQKAMAEGVPVRTEVFAALPRKWLEIHAYPHRQGLSLYVHDITERKEAERERGRLATAVEATAEGVGVMDADGIVAYVNPAFCKMTGYRREEIVGCDIRVLHKADEASVDHLWKAVREQRAWSGLLKTKKKDGTLFERETTLSPIRDSAGNVTEYVTVSRDVTGERQLKKHVQQMQKMEAIGTLAGGIAHDMNNILAAIIGNVELAFDTIPEGNEAKFNLEQVFKASMRARDLVKQILTFSRKGKQRLTTVHLAPLIKEVSKLLRSALPTTIEIVTALKAENDAAQADVSQIQQVLMNLAANAEHAMRKKGGTLEIVLDNARLSSLTAPSGIAPGDYVALTVRDTGHGMTDDIKDKIFDPFFTTKEHGQGTGLGLAVVHGIVKNHKGGVSVASEPGKGTEFTIYLPESPVAREEDGQSERVLPRGSEHVLFVDDEEALVRLAEDTLGLLGYKVTGKTNSAEALAVFLQDPYAFDLVVTDQTMPLMTGAGLTEKLLEVRPDIPVILVTGYSETISPEKAKKAGITEFMMKPLTKGEMAMVVRTVLDRARGMTA